MARLQETVQDEAARQEVGKGLEGLRQALRAYVGAIKVQVAVVDSVHL